MSHNVVEVPGLAEPVTAVTLERCARLLEAGAPLARMIEREPLEFCESLASAASRQALLDGDFEEAEQAANVAVLVSMVRDGRGIVARVAGGIVWVAL